MKMNIGIDMDGVCSDFTFSFLRLAKELGLHKGEINGAAGQPQFGFPFSVDPVWKMVDSIPNWWMTLPSLMSGEDVFWINEAIHHVGVTFLTARKSGSGFPIETQTRLWLLSMGVQAEHPSVLVHANLNDKGKICVDLGVTHFLDDKLENLVDMALNYVEVTCRAWDYNVDWKTPRVRSITEYIRPLVEEFRRNEAGNTDRTIDRLVSP